MFEPFIYLYDYLFHGDWQFGVLLLLTIIALTLIFKRR